MNYKVIEIESLNGDDAVVEMRFAVADARAGGAELVRIDVPFGEDEKVYKNIFSTLVRTLKLMKDERKIQFYATEKNFSSSSTEAAFLLNKYPSIFICGITDNENAGYIYIKI